MGFYTAIPALGAAAIPAFWLLRGSLSDSSLLFNLAGTATRATTGIFQVAANHKHTSTARCQIHPSSENWKSVDMTPLKLVELAICRVQDTIKATSKTPHALGEDVRFKRAGKPKDKANGRRKDLKTTRAGPQSRNIHFKFINMSIHLRTTTTRS